MHRSKVTDGNRIFLISLVITFITLSAVAIYVLYLPQTPTIKHLPAQIPLEAPNWIKYVSIDAEKISLLNITQILRSTGNYSLFTSDKLLIIQGFQTELSLNDTIFSATIIYPGSDEDSEDLILNIVEPKTEVYQALELELKEKSELRYPYQNNTIYKVTRYTMGTPAFVTGYMALDEGYLLYAEYSTGLDLIKKNLESKHTSNSIFEQPNVKASIYLISFGQGDLLGISYSTFPYFVKEVVSTSVSLRYEGQSLIAHYAYSFNDTNTAMKNFDNLKSSNSNATGFEIFDNYIVAIEKFDKSHLIRELRIL